MKRIRRHAEQGIATVLMLLLIGLTVSAAVVGTVYYINSAQEQGVSLHGQTQAQIKAWTGVQIVQGYLQQVVANDVSNGTTTLKTLAAAISDAGTAGIPLSITGVSGITAKAVAVDSATNPTTITFDVTGVSAAGTRAESSSTIRSVFSIPASTSSSSGSGSCGTSPKASAVFKGDVSITGGSTSVSAGSDYAAIAVEGALTIGSASQAKISGCTTGDISLSGGGIYDNAYLYSQDGTITINQMSTPVNATLWGKAINIGNTGTGGYASLKAGAYAVSVISEGATVGTAKAGGRLLASTAAGTPWSSGTVVPWNSGTLLVTLSDSTQFLVDLKSVTIDSTTGQVTGVQAASTQLSGSGAIPDTITLRAASVYGGSIDLYNLVVTETWGYNLTFKGYGGTYSSVKPAGNFKAITPTISTLTGGGYLWATGGGCSGSSCWNFPTVNAGAIAADVYYGSAQTLFSGSSSTFKFSKNQTSTSPGLPGVPFCDTRVNKMDVSDYATQANYIFNFNGNVPTLTVQNVKTKSGTSLDGTYDLQSGDVRKLGTLPFMTCNWATDPGNSSAHCLRTASPSTGWTLTGITHFPPGITLFYGNVTVDGIQASSQAVLNDSLMATGSVTLTSSGHVPLRAPNYAGATVTCDGDIYPTNLCNKTTSPSTLATWKDSSGNSHTGLPIGNIALATNQNLTSSGWQLDGIVIVGQRVYTEGATTSINGTLTVGANRQDASDSSTTTTITAGGLQVNTSSVTNDQGYSPNGSCSAGTNTTGTVKVLWTRYL